MNSFELNKILGALLGTCLVLLAVHIAAGAIFAPQVPAKPGYEIAVKEEQRRQAKPRARRRGRSSRSRALLASASVERGAQIAKQCQACHNLQEGRGPTRSAPISMAWSAAQRRVAAGLQLFGRH